MFYYLHFLSETHSFLRMFQYITVRAFAGAGTAFLLSLILGPWIIKRLQRKCSGELTRYQEHSPVLDELHGEKKKITPTMGGLLIILAVSVSSLLWVIPSSPLLWLTLGTFWVFGAIGLADDYVKVVLRRSGGLRGIVKLALEIFWVLIVFILMAYLPETKENVYKLMVPFFKDPILYNTGNILAFLIIVSVVVGAGNAVNLTDGLDGLAIGCTSSVAFSYLVLAYVTGHIQFAAYLQIPYIPGAGELAVFCGCLLGGALGFLWFNCHPAHIFMGDTGSLALGGTLGIIAVLIKHELALLVIGGVFVAEALSVIIQVACFKWTGRRFFACAPLHHHFELKKTNRWSETQVTIRFWIISIICSLFGILLLKLR